jgi:hypothetical protein
MHAIEAQYDKLIQKHGKPEPVRLAEGVR